MLKMPHSVISALLLATLTACGGGGGIGTGDTSSSSSSSSSSGGGSSSGGNTSTIRLGVRSGDTFTPGDIGVTVENLSAGASTGLRVDIVDTANGNAAVTSATSVTFSSPCISNGKAIVTPNPVLTSTGSATANYQARGCSGSDTIVASASVASGTISAQHTVTVMAAPVSSIQFSSATPTAIRIKGTGDPQTSTVVFKITDSAGGPVDGQRVRFTLDTNAGGITLTPANGIATSDSNGNAQIIVNSGTVATSVRVTGTLIDAAGNTVSGISPGQSDSLVISTALADQDSFSLSAGCLNIEGNSIDGVTTPIVIRASDRFNNPVPDGTAVAFRTEGGQVSSQCLTTAGSCSVPFTSTSPRTADHRVTVLATAIGEESFVDSNGNGKFNTPESFLDLPEAFLDRNENGGRESNEEFVDFDNDNAYDVASGNFTGVLCESGCDARTALSVRASLPIIMSSSQAVLDISPSFIDLSNGPVAVQVTVGDTANQPMAGGTIIEGASTFGTISGDARRTQACSAANSPFVYTYVIEAPNGQATAASGTFNIKVTSPSGVVSTITAGVRFTPTPTQPPTSPGMLSAINFVSVTPSDIAIRGSGQNERSTVQFKVLSDTGAPIAGQTVNFSLDTTVGGITLSRASAVSDSNGLVSTVVNSGTVHTTVRVSARTSAGATTVTAQSDRIVISTGIADQDSVSISASRLNIEAANFDGITSGITIRLADRFNNPVPDGTAVAFTSEGGSIGSQCTTSGGACTVTFTSANPRVANHRYTITATTIGEESFTDANGNGQFDSGEAFGDVGEAFIDKNENGIRDTGAQTEEFLDFNNNGMFDGPSGNFTGVLCNGGCDSARSLHVRGSMVLVLSSSAAVINAPAFTLVPDQQRQYPFTILDEAGQSMAAGTTILVSTSYGAIVGDASFSQVDTNASGGTTYSVLLKGESRAGSGFLNIKVTSPSGRITTELVPIN